MAGRSLRGPSGHPPNHYPALGKVSVFHFTDGMPKKQAGPGKGLIAGTGLIRQRHWGRRRIARTLALHPVNECPKLFLLLSDICSCPAKIPRLSATN